MPRGKPWLPIEDQLVMAAARDNFRRGLAKPMRDREECLAKGDLDGAREGYQRRLERLAVDLGRTYAAVRKRAERLEARSYRGSQTG